MVRDMMVENEPETRKTYWQHPPHRHFPLVSKSMPLANILLVVGVGAGDVDAGRGIFDMGSVRLESVLVGSGFGVGGLQGVSAFLLQGEQAVSSSPAKTENRSGSPHFRCRSRYRSG